MRLEGMANWWQISSALPERDSISQPAVQPAEDRNERDQKRSDQHLGDVAWTVVRIFEPPDDKTQGKSSPNTSGGQCQPLPGCQRREHHHRRRQHDHIVIPRAAGMDSLPKMARMFAKQE